MTLFLFLLLPEWPLSSCSTQTNFVEGSLPSELAASQICVQMYFVVFVGNVSICSSLKIRQIPSYSCYENGIWDFFES